MARGASPPRACATGARFLTVENNQATALTIGNVTASGDYSVTGNTCGSSLKAFGSCTLKLNFSPDVIGADNGILSIVDGPDPNGPYSIPLTGTGMAPLGYSPASIAFGNIASGETSAARTVTLHNGTTATTLSLSTAASGSGFSVSGGTCGSSLAAGSSCTVELSFTPSANGTVTGSLNITDSPDSGSPHSLALMGTGK